MCLITSTNTYFLSENDQPCGITCGLFPEVVQVEPDVNNLKNCPQFLQVNRCRGSCDSALILKPCVPTKKHNIRVKVYTESGNSYDVDVEDYEECTCDCQVQCIPEIHDRNDNLCKCECREKCPDGEGQDPSTCKCNG